MKLWKRKIEIITADKSFTNDNFEIDFKIDFDQDPEPNISEVKIFNLSDSTIESIRKDKTIILNAGYEGDVGSILIGGIAKVETSWEGVDKLIKLLVGDGSKEWYRTKVSNTYKAGITAKQILNDLTGIFGLEIGEITVADNIVYKNGRSVSGTLESAIRSIVKDTKSKFYINHGKIYIRPWDEGTVTGFVLNADTGLIETPVPFEEEIDGKMIFGYKVKMLLNHRINIDSILKIESKTANGIYRVIKGSHHGDFITNVEVVGK
ncbi:conserved hypothetical protein [Desulfonispora thiosulfatigenes DSM 11270]|uniref:Uncharacterized protein n=1 Tax=Desulfonispora thiosulfatigenes DSM 11270 TaxID=656914 RepID=A0A1W1VQ31_DESTI|nr:hypothetical protein [Desulfonispora thiosulfatigenes]SMB95330.1 conserved hypothetical protein [Desulfonispora thiosulfatigenes DSM 11270]